MDAVALIAIAVAVPVVLFPAAFIWYINIGGMAKAYKEARAARKAEVKE